MFPKIVAAFALTVVAVGANAQNYKPGSVLLATPSIQQVELDHKVKVKKRLGKLDVYEVSVPQGKEVAFVEKLKADKKVRFAELNVKVPPAYVPNDQYYGQAWHLPNIRANDAWDITEGEGVIVAVADTGVNKDHPDLVGKVLPGTNVVDGSGDYSDIQGHGTFVAGTIGAYTNNSIGVASIAGKVKILPIRVTNAADGWAYYSDMADAVLYAADYGAKVVNVSYSGGGNTATIQAAAEYMVKKGGVVVWSAGNAGVDQGFYDNPNIILVSATNSSNVRTSWSSFGTYVDIAAPGESILTTSRDLGYYYVNGTSFSAPIVAGVVANMFSVNPYLSPAQVDQILKSTAVDLGDPGEDIYYGAGKVNAYTAVLVASTTTGTRVDVTPPNVTLTAPTTVSGRKSVKIYVTAIDTENQISEITLYINDSVVYNGFSTGSIVYNWNIGKIPKGQYTIKATATDAAGNSTTVTTIVTKI